ncbi:sugar transporter [Aspergillus aculeatinus CBS 121060]|uniref:Sugar transporter n=1 Tax=Aspergillus aculeatinus CBS 121060 TaxID=1448322 RepID=A0ACD1GVI6_9EURO|nr:sugar transporter [Aspergillus aculeatinus CBS 121060]RAH65336.1 sugar transporter [Aspergillus aculeatinus CBS 121060]
MYSSAKSLQLAQRIFVIAPAFILYGYNQAGLSALLTLSDVIRLFPQIDTVNTDGAQEAQNSTIKGLINGTLMLGALLGALSCSIVGDKLGRRKTIFVGGCCAAVGQILQCTAFSLAQFTVGRIILGFGVGQLSVIVPVWQAESSSAGKRGRQVITSGIFICVGFFLSSWINLGCSKIASPPLQWRIPLAIPVVFSLVICFSIFTLPESPRWLVQRGRISAATEALAALNDMPSDHDLIRREVSRINASLSTGPTISLRDVFRKNDPHRLGYRFALCLGIQTLQQLVGGNMISIYTTTIFQDNLHLQGDTPAIVAASALTWKFLCSFLSFAAVDRLGRRWILVTSGTGMCLCMIAMAVATSFPASNHAASVTAAVFIFLFNMAYPIGFLGGNFLYCTEIAPAPLRAVMSSISTANHWMWNFIITMVTPVALSTIGWRYYIVFACTCACVPVIVLLFFPETMNRDLELIDGVFREAPTIWEIVPMARRLPQQSSPSARVDNDREKAVEAEGTTEEQREFA